MITAIVGMGEIGRALADVLRVEYEIIAKDRGPWVRAGELTSAEDVRGVDVLHVCFPWSETFLRDVQALERECEPGHIVVHSTVPVGTCRLLGVCHSPVIGRHPRLAESLRTFRKFVSGPDASAVADHFRRAGVEVCLIDSQNTTELLKLLCTTVFGVQVEITKEVKRLCDAFGVPFEAWRVWNSEYNRGYEALGVGNVRRPELEPIMRVIGGHCVGANAEILRDEMAVESWLLEILGAAES